MPYQLEIYGASSGKGSTIVMKFINYLMDGYQVYVVTKSPQGNWKKLRCVNKFMDIQDLSCWINDKNIDGYD